jgi:hypothetical protein
VDELAARLGVELHLDEFEAVRAGDLDEVEHAGSVEERARAR